MIARLSEYGLYVLSFIFIVISVSTSKWTVKEDDNDNAEFDIGAFRACGPDNCENSLDESFSRFYDDDAVRSARAFSIIGILGIGLGVISALAEDFQCMSPSETSKRISIYTPFVVLSSFILAGLSWFSVHDDLDDRFDDLSTGHGWVLCFIAIIPVAIAGLLPHTPEDLKSALCGGGKKSDSGSRDQSGLPQEDDV
eukprot:gb/GECG01016776.1/.p1 GENE.gb/GECG01016776.1/~~gb/GECG01016776.1/.p1  ORF type:complete len:197 (+),score=24.34 gb/GECG01016776.1/:1-591(+)